MFTTSRSHAFSPRPRPAFVWLLAAAVPLLFACESDSQRPRLVEADELYWELVLNHRAVLLSTTPPYDTLTLVATPRNASGEAMAGLPAPVYTSTNLDRVRVDPGGVLRGLQPTTGAIWVRATITANELKHTDSVLVQVVANAQPPVLETFSVDPVFPDTAKSGLYSSQGLGPSRTLLVHASDASGTPMAGFPVYFGSSDPTIGTINRATGLVLPKQPGTVKFFASTMIFGVAKADTVEYKFGWPVQAKIAFERYLPVGAADSVTAFVPSEIRVGVGALVEWSASRGFQGSAWEMDITFPDADLPKIAAANTSWAYVTSPQSTLLVSFCTLYPLFGLGFYDCENSGNITMTDPGPPSFDFVNGAFRVFTAPGTYEYHSPNHNGASGRVIVVADE